jgi:PAS domain S-box-containing protein
MIVSLLITTLIVILTVRRRQVPGASAMISLGIATFIWTAGFLLEANSTTLERQLFFNNIGYIGSTAVPVALFFFALNYTTDNRRNSVWRVLAFCVIPLLSLILVWTNKYHNMMWYDEHLAESGPFTVTVKTYGLFFWIMLVYNYMLVLGASIILIRRLFTGARLYTGQAISLIIAVSLPWIWNAIYVFHILELPRKDLTPVMFAISGLFIILGLMRFQLLAAIPFARRFLIEHLNDGVLAFDMHKRLLEANRMALTLFGLDKKIIGSKIEGDSPLKTITDRFSLEFTESVELPLTVANEVRINELETVPMYDDHHRQVGWMAILRDITERKRHELEYRTIIQTTADGFWLTDLQGRILDVNNAYCHMVGYSREELLEMSITDIEVIEKPETINMHIERIMHEGKDRFETRHRHKNGTLIDVDISVNFLDFGGGRMIIFIRDVTERNKMQEQLIAQDRLVSIGQLTAGVAHELNNPLTSVVGFSELLLERELPADIIADINIIHSEAERAARIVENLLTFSRKHREEKILTDINEVIEKTLRLRTGEQKLNNIKTVINLANNLPLIMGSALQLQQVFLNIIVNAEFFMLEAHKRGTLVITSEQKDDYVRISIKDDGPGIPQENLKHVFNPFFTTKAVGKGTGLGLSICHGIISEHGGRIWAESKPGEGATFIIELPVITAANNSNSGVSDIL